MRRFTVAITLSLVLAPLGAGAAKVPEASLCWANRLLAGASFDRQLSSACRALYDLKYAEQAFQDIRRKYESSDPRVELGLARVQTALGKYAKAVETYNSVLAHLPPVVSKQSPTRADLRQEMEQAQAQQKVAEAAALFVPKSHGVLQALRYPAKGKTNLWAVLSAKVDRTNEGKWGWPEISDSRLTVFSGEPDRLERVWQSGVLGAPGHTDGEFNDVYLHVKDVTGDGSPDLVIPEIFVGGSWAPSHLDIYTWRGGGIVHLLGAKSDDPIMMKDLNRDGRYEAMANHAIGWDLSHAEQPRWLDIYAYRDNSYQPAEKDFPEQYHSLYREVQAALREVPGDFELLYYLGRLYEIRSRPQLALSNYRLAEKGAIKTIAGCRGRGWTDLERSVTNLLAEIRARIRVLNRSR